jgi:hypothetical protein
MPKAKTQIQYDYRFLNMPKSMASSLRISHSNLKWWEHNNPNNTVNIGFKVLKTADYKKFITFFKKHKLLSKAKRGLFISLTCFEDQSGFTMAEHARQLHGSLGGEVDVSIVFSM